MILKNFKISQKIYFLGIAQLILMLVMGLVSITQMNKIGNELVDIAEDDIPLTRSLTKITEHQLLQALTFEKTLVKALKIEREGEKHRSKMLAYSEETANLAELVAKEVAETEAFIRSAIPKLHSEKAVEEYEKLLKQLGVLSKDFSNLNSKVINFLELARNNQIDELLARAPEIEKMEDKLDEALIVMLDEVQGFTLAAAGQARKDEENAIFWQIVIFVVAVLFGISTPFFIARSISVPVNELAIRLDQVAGGDGDLTIKLDDRAKDETGDVARAFNRFIESIRQLIANTNVQADALGNSSEQALDAMQKTLLDVDQQRLETEMVATAVNEMSATTQEVARNAASASTITDQVAQNVMEGRQEAVGTHSIIEKLNQEVSDASQVLEDLVSETNKIGSVLDSIQGIAEQTNLLALNAAIEAARAGESGRGFAVVADEVRSLAQRTQNSTLDIQGLVERLQAETQNAVASMNKGSESAQLCLHKSEETTQTFDRAAKSVQEISDLNTQIAVAADQQSQVAEEVNRNLNNIQDMANSTTEGTQRTAAANETIAKSLIDLNTSLNMFQT